MFIVELAFDDNPERLQARPAHRERLDRLHQDGIVRMAGPFADDTGALLVFDTDASGLAAILEQDPYYNTPGVTVVRRSEWKPFIS
jgi:uncharacterized protein YciI